MTNPFNDQTKFMTACDQSVGVFDKQQYELYLALVSEETKELAEALEADDKKEQLDALIDMMVVTIGALNSLGVDPEGAWNEVMRTNFEKIDPNTGKVNKRSDGKVLKPEGWKPPNLESFIK